jgi:murein DD-endopeptidase MepM/ murein hydrolase activator NlpD
MYFFSDFITMKQKIIPVLFVIFFIFIIYNTSYAGKKSYSKDRNLNNISDIENAIIIKGIESEFDGLENSEGSIIYDNSFNEITTPKNDKDNTQENKKSDNLINILKKSDSKWHNTLHRIRKGENLWSIAKKYNTDYKNIISVNNINNPNRLNPGNTILVPNRNGINHKILKNETLTGISRKYKIKKNTITAHNKIKNEIIREGKYIFIPDASEPEIKISKSSVKNSKTTNIVYPEDEEPGDIPSGRLTGNDRQKFIWPISGGITSSFGKRINPISNKSNFHCGLDISAAIDTPVKASADGETIFSGWKKGYGRVVILKHSDGYITVYAHNKTNIANSGDQIRQGEILAYSGISGAVTGPHLHFEIRKYLTPLNPLRLLKQ